MKQVYTYSQKQYNVRSSTIYFGNDESNFVYQTKSHDNYINNKLFTQQQSFEDDAIIDFNVINKWDDNVIVHITENLSFDESYFELFGSKVSDTKSENITTKQKY